VLQNLQDRARATNLSLRRFTPKDDFQKDFCSGKPVEVEITSTFANLRSFYEELAKMQRIVSITDFNIKQSPDQTSNKTIDAQFLLTAYYLSPQQQQQSKPAGPAPATQQPAAPAPAK
jgi:Tfp pilus assembly protein PilO